MRTPRPAFTVLSVFLMAAAHGVTTIPLTRVEYEGRVRAVWTAQIIAVLLAWPHEHQVASSVWLVCGETVTLRLYQRVLVPNKTAGNAYWKAIEVK